MNAATHLVASTCIAQAVAVIGRSVRPHDTSRRYRTTLFGIGAILILAMHFLLDALPHFSWVVFSYRFLPRRAWADWLVRESCCAVLGAIPCLWWGRHHLGRVIPAMLLGLYPDLEKGAYLAELLGKGHTLFYWHSTLCRPRLYHVAPLVLLTAELCLLGTLLIATRRLSLQRTPPIDEPGT